MPRSTQNGRKRRRRRPTDPPPEPPPPPPQALVDLLKADSSVLEYFTSLQTCLDADVAQWKNRALAYKQECNHLQEQLEQARMQLDAKPTQAKRKQSKAKEKDGRQTKRRDSSKDSQVSSSKKVDNGKHHPSPPRTNEQVDDDFALFFSSDSDASRVANETIEEGQEPTTTDWSTYGLLLEAFNNLRQLGVDLVVEETTVETTTQMNGATIAVQHEPASDETNDQQQEQSTIRKRRSDEHVIADLLLAIHTLTRIQLQLTDSEGTHPPFSTDTLHIPCCNMESHPAGQGKECILQALQVMDVYCTRMSDSEWNKLFPPSCTDDAIRIGMRDRKRLVDVLLSSLTGEISDFWAVSDRSSRLVNTGLHYEENGEEDIVSFASSWGAKSQARLSDLAERCLLAQLVTSMLYRRNEHQEVATLIWRYFLSSVPSFGVEDYPRLPPVLSLCVLESLLSPYTQSTELLQLHASDSSNDNETPSLWCRTFALAVHASGCVWKMRKSSSDDRISNISRVELAAFDRLCQTHSSWLPNEQCTEKADKVCGDAKSLLVDALGSCRSLVTTTPASAAQSSVAVQVALIVVGDMQSVLDTCRDSTNEVDRDRIPFACCSAFRQLQARQLDTFRAKQGSLAEASTPVASLVSDQLVSIVDSLSEMFEVAPNTMDTMIKCYVQMSLAENVFYTLLQWFSRSEMHESWRLNLATTASYYLGTCFGTRKYPVVRVINLERRHDRMKTFMTQGQSQRILVAKAVAQLNADDDTSSWPCFDDNSFDATHVWGLHALDGQGGPVEVASRLSKEIGGSLSLSEFVESHWRPSDLKAFDKDARNDDSLVFVSPSESACALSHVGSWKGVYRSLLLRSSPGNNDDPRRGIAFPFLISGYATGRPLLASNEQMAPTPVCVILEDDAILVDRFTDRLASLLQELPRDFHFCSIGYSRPKTAPIAKYSEFLGIPSCTWYLTGYILSLEGAKHLLNSLPVRGPVDSWIGMKMCANWDNVFGQAMGVGARASTVSSEVPSRKDLARILKFRAFAALVPLCSQKVNTTTNATAGRSWRQRDTDITYSGNL